MSFFDDYGDEMPEEFESFAAGVRAAATRIPEPSPNLAHLLAHGVSSPQPKRSVVMKVKTYVAGLGLAAKVMLGAGVAAAATTGAGAAGVLPEPVQHAFDHVVPGAQSNEHSVEAAADHESHEHATSTTSTTAALTTGDDHGEHQPETPVVVEPTTTTSTTVVHHEEHHDNPSTTTTTVRHDEPTTTSTTRVENHNPESISLTCVAAHEPNRVTCHWTASTNPDHRRYALLRTNNMNSEGRVVAQTEDHLEFTDTTVNAGWTYTYRVVSLREDGSTESHSNGAVVSCC